MAYGVRKERRRRGRKAQLLVLLAISLIAICSVIVIWKVGEFVYDYYARFSRYDELIVKAGQRNNVDPCLIKAVIWKESRFDKRARGLKGEVGLMQIMPETGEWLAGKFGEAADYAPDRLFDANTNLRYGCWYLGYLARLFGGDMVKMAAGYHAGQNRVARWLEDRSISPDGHTLPVDKIPFADTKQYVERVVKAHAIYQKRYWSEKAR